MCTICSTPAQLRNESRPSRRRGGDSQAKDTNQNPAREPKGMRGGTVLGKEGAKGYKNKRRGFKLVSSPNTYKQA